MVQNSNKILDSKERIVLWREFSSFLLSQGSGVVKEGLSGILKWDFGLTELYVWS